MISKITPIIDWLLRIVALKDIWNTIKDWYDKQSQSEKEELEKELEREKETTKDEKVAFLNVMLKKGIISSADVDKINRIA